MMAPPLKTLDVPRSFPVPYQRRAESRSLENVAIALVSRCRTIPLWMRYVSVCVMLKNGARTRNIWKSFVKTQLLSANFGELAEPRSEIAWAQKPTIMCCGGVLEPRSLHRRWCRRCFRLPRDAATSVARPTAAVIHAVHQALRHPLHYHGKGLEDVAQGTAQFGRLP
jgi:hypothetical protein